MSSGRMTELSLLVLNVEMHNISYLIVVRGVFQALIKHMI